MQVVQRVTSSNNPASFARPSAGNLLRVWCYAATQTPPSLGAGWQLIASAGQAAGPVSLALWAKIAEGDETGVAIAGTPPDQYRIEVAECASDGEPWPSAASAFIAVAAHHGNGVQSNSISTPEITVPREALIEAAMGCTAGSANFTVSSPFAIRSEIAGRLVVADTEGDGTHQASFAYGNNRHWAAGICAIAEPPEPPTPPPVEVRESAPDDTLILYVGEPDGGSRRIGPDERRGLALGSLTFTTTLPGGFAAADAKATLSERPIELPRKFAPVTIRDVSGSLVWEGRIDSPAEYTDDGQIALKMVGHQAQLTDHPGIVFVGVLTDLSEWGEPPREWVRSESQAGRVVNRRLTASVGEGGLQITMDTDVNVPPKHRGVAWLTLPAGQRAARVEYVSSQLAAADMQTRFTFVPDDLQSGEVHPTTNDLTVRAVVPTEPTRHVRAVATPGSSVNKTDEFVWTLHRIAVFGDHGLPRYPIGSNTPAGLRWSDVLEYLVPLHTTLATDIEPSSVVAQQIAVLDPTDLGEILQEAVAFERDRDWAVYDGPQGPTLYVRRRREFGRVWVARRGDGADFSGLGPASELDHDSVIVAFDDQDGMRRTVGPPGSGCDVEDASLQDASPDNPVVASPVVATRPKLVEVSEPIDTAKAIEIGQIALADALIPRYSGEIRLPRLAECEGEMQPTYTLRAGDRIVDGDDPQGREMLVVETSWSSEPDDGRPMRCTIDTPADRLDAALAGLAVRPQPINRKRLLRRLRKERRRRRHERDLRRTVTGPAKSGTGVAGRGRKT